MKIEKIAVVAEAEEKAKKFSFQLSAFLITEKTKNLNSLISCNFNDISEFKINDEFGLDGSIFVKKKPDELSRPKWSTHLDKLHGKKIDHLEKSSSSAVLILKLEKGIIAFSFGYGRHLLKDEILCTDFGIKTALNTLNHETLNSVDLLSLDTSPIQKRNQAIKSSHINNFGVDVSRDVLKAVTGQAISDISWQNISGSGNHYTFTATISDYAELSAIGNKLIEKYNLPDYKENFSWVDNIQRVKNSIEIGKLNSALIEKLKQKESKKITLNAPNITDWINVSGFSYTNGKDEYKASPDILDYYEINDPKEITIEKLKAHQLHCYNTTEDEATSFSIYNCIYFEYEFDGKLHILFDKEWFTIDQNYVSRVEDSLKLIEITKLKFPPVKMTKKKVKKTRGKSKEIKEVDNEVYESEQDYNIRISESLNFELMDRKLVKSDSSASPIEVCDLINNNMFIHVKHKKGNSAGLSHLFAQGRVSSELLISDQNFRKKAREHLEGKAQDLIPDIIFYPENFEIAFLILGIKGNNILDELPFFSKINLIGAYKSLTERKYKVSIAGSAIEEVIAI